MLKIRSLVAVVVVFGACGGGGGESAPDLTGWYGIDSITESLATPGGPPATCQGEGPPGAGSYLFLEVDTSFGSLDWSLCDVAQDPSSCVSEFFSFDDISGEWQIGAATSASYSGGGCSLFHAEGSVRPDSADQAKLRLELKVWDEFRTVPESECTLSAADALAGQDACERHVVINATAL
jgi:hypothetical protein